MVGRFITVQMTDSMEFFLNVFTEFSDKNYLSLKVLNWNVTSCVRDQDATTVQQVPNKHV